MQSDTEQRVKLLVREAVKRRKLMVAGFAVISLALAAAGLFWPKQYHSSTTIFVEEQSIIEPLMRGTAVRGDVIDRARNAREIIYGRSIMMKVLENGGWLAANPSPAQVESLLEGLRGRTIITNVGQNLIKIDFTGGDPQRVYESTALMAELFIEEMLAARAKESNAAFEFIDNQVHKYESELLAGEERLKNLRDQHAEARPGAATEASQRIANLRTRIDELEQELREAQISETSLVAQLNGEVEGASAASRAGQYRSRIAELQESLATLRLSYHDSYPDVVQLKQQLAELQQGLQAEEQRAQTARQDVAPGERRMANEAARNSPVYQQLQRDLYDKRTQVQTLVARLEDSRNKLELELARAQRIQDVAAHFQKLTRDYEVNQTIYQDLLRRRENARVTMNLNTEQQGLTLRITEPAYFSHKPSGPRMIHFAAGGVLLGAIFPLGLLFGFLMVDPRIRMPSTITDDLKLPVLEVIPHLATVDETRAERRGLVWAVLIAVVTVGVILAVLWLRAAGEI